MKIIFNNLLLILLIGAVVYYLSGCQKDENIKSTPGKPEKQLVGFTGGNNALNRIKVIHLYKDTVYILSEPFFRDAGEQLIIDEGVLVKVDISGASVGIRINPGGVMVATGTSANPIVFTSNAPTGNQNANWAGITIQGRSFNNSSPDPGIPGDFSGLLNYVRIEFAPFRLISVGTNSSIENVQVSYAGPQPSFEFDGGSFDAKNLLSFACGGPADFYITGGYQGRLQNLLAYRHPFFGKTGDYPPNTICGVFIENNRVDPQASPSTFPVISNLTVLGPNSLNGSATAYTDSLTRSAALVTTGSAFFSIRNSLFSGFPAAGWYLDDSVTARRIQYGESEFSYSVIQCNDTARTFFLKPQTYPPFETADFKSFILRPELYNQTFASLSELMLNSPFDYDQSPDPAPKPNSPLNGGANFDGPVYSDPFFEKVSYRGALGKENWARGWTNFIPLKTSYNFPK